MRPRSQGWKEGSAADIHARILKKPCCRSELDRAIIYNVDVPAGTLSPDSDQRPQTSTPRYKKPFRDLVERGRVMRAYRKPKSKDARSESALHVFSDHSLVGCVIFERGRETERERETLLSEERKGLRCFARFFSPTRAPQLWGTTVRRVFETYFVNSRPPRCLSSTSASPLLLLFDIKNRFNSIGRFAGKLAKLAPRLFFPEQKFRDHSLAFSSVLPPVMLLFGDRSSVHPAREERRGRGEKQRGR